MSLSSGVILSSSSHCSTRLLLCSSLEKEGMLSPPSRTLDALTVPALFLEVMPPTQQDWATRGILGVVAPLDSLLVPWDEVAAAHRAQPAEHGRGLPGRG